tara:strand:- start:427 stop:786 length:360 start_codon:yes stop_codon:yes gene_type:complete
MQNSFDFKDKYPYKAGHRNVDTSIKAAEKTNKNLKRICKIVLVELGKVYPKGLTGSEIAKNANRSLFSIRPRTTELKHQGLIIDTEKRRKNEYDNTEIIYKLRALEVLKDFDIDIDKSY